MGEYALSVSFDTDAPEFCRGVEVGMIYEHLRLNPGPVSTAMRVANALMAARIAEAAQRSIRTEEFDGCWMHVHFGPRGSA